MKAIRWLLKLVLAMITLPLILAVWLIKWFVVFCIIVRHAVPQLPERYLSRKAGIVRCCLGKKVVQDLISGGLHCLWGRVNQLRRTPQLVAIFGRRNAV